MTIIAAFTDGMRNPVLSTLLGYSIFVWFVGNFAFHFVREWLKSQE